MTFDRKKYKSFALMQLKGRWKTAFIATLISIILLTFFSVTQKQNQTLSYSQIKNLTEQQLLEYISSNPQYSGPGLILLVISTIVNFIVEMVLVSLFLIYSRSPEPVTLKNYFECYNKWARGILTGLWKTLWLFLWGLISIPVILLFSFLLALFASNLTIELTQIILPILLLIALIPMFIKSIEYSFVFFFTAEFSEIGIRKALRMSILLAKGHRWDIFVLELSFIGWFLICMMSLGIGFLWLLPYYYMTMTNAYHALLQDALETGKIKPEDLNS